jgi:hypothetical protein
MRRNDNKISYPPPLPPPPPPCDVHFAPFSIADVCVCGGGVMSCGRCVPAQRWRCALQLELRRHVRNDGADVDLEQGVRVWGRVARDGTLSSESSITVLSAAQRARTQPCKPSVTAGLAMPYIQHPPSCDCCCGTHALPLIPAVRTFPQ